MRQGGLATFGHTPLPPLPHPKNLKSATNPHQVAPEPQATRRQSQDQAKPGPSHTSHRATGQKGRVSRRSTVADACARRGLRRAMVGSSVAASTAADMANSRLQAAHTCRVADRAGRRGLNFTRFLRVYRPARAKALQTLDICHVCGGLATLYVPLATVDYSSCRRRKHRRAVKVESAVAEVAGMAWVGPGMGAKVVVRTRRGRGTCEGAPAYI